MPYFTKILYYLDKQETSLYSYIPQGIPNIPRLIKNLAAWRRENFSTMLKQKSLILADWTISTWSVKKRKQVKSIFTELLDQGFSIYIWLDKEVRLLTKEGLDLLGSYHIAPEPPDNISTQAITTHYLTKDKVFVLDDYWLNILLEEEEELPPRRLFTSTLAQYKGKKEDLNKLISFLKSVHPPLKEVVHDVFSETVDKLLIEFLQAFPNIQVNYAYKKIELNTENEVNMLVKKKQSLVLPSGARLDFSQLSHLEYPKLSVKGSQELQLLFDAFPLLSSHLNAFYINYYREGSDNYRNFDSKVLLNLNIKKLEKFDFYASSLAPIPPDLLNLFKEAENLTSLSLSHLDIEISERFNFPSLEKLSLQKLNITPESLAQCLNSTSFLKKLSLKFCYSLGTFSCLLTLDWTKLEELSLLKSLPATLIESILDKTSSLKKLQLDFCPKNLVLPSLLSLELFSFPDSSALNDKKARLDRLKSLTLSNYEIKDLSAFLATTPQLEKLDLENCSTNMSNDISSLDKLALKSLSIWFDHKMSFQELDCLLRAQSKSLESLNLHFDDLKKEYLSPSLYFPSLVFFGATQISKKNLKILLRASPSLKKIELPNGHSLDAELIELIKVKGIQVVDMWDEMDTSLLTKLHLPHTTDGVDANTEYTPQTYHPNRIFLPLTEGIPKPSVNLYRLGVYNSLSLKEVPCSPEEAFHMKNEGDLALKTLPLQRVKDQETLLALGKREAAKEKAANYYWAEERIELSPRWQALPSLSPQEVLSHYALDSEEEVEIRYSERDSLYYIRSNTPKLTTLSFLLKIDPRSPPTLPKDIQEAVVDFRSFGAEALDLEEEASPDGKAYLEAIVSQRKGACRHRAIAFKALMERDYPDIPLRMVNNVSHAFVELFFKGQWLTLDLGGYPASVEVREKREPLSTEESSPVVSFSQEESFPEEAYYTEALSTWKAGLLPVNSLLAYSQSLLQPDKDKARLVMLSSKEEVEGLALALQSYCQHSSRPFFFVQSPEELVCEASFVKAEGRRGKLSKGPGGPLDDFLKRPIDKANPPVLLVNYDNFTADDLVRFNSLLDDKRFADNTPLPEELLVLGLINTHRLDCYQGSDFYSRFDRKETPSFSKEVLSTQLKAIVPLSFLPKDSSSPKTFGIDFFHSNNWKEILLGYWEIQGDCLQYVEGVLEAALHSGLPLELKNIPWQEEEAFRLFWKQLSLRGSLECAGRVVPLPRPLTLFTSEGYDGEDYQDQVSFKQGFSEGALVLNPSELSHFFKVYCCQAERLYSRPGHIKNHAQKTLPLNLTSALDEDSWARLLSEAKTYGVKLDIHCNFPLRLPPALAKGFTPVAEPFLPGPALRSFVTTDRDTTLAQLEKEGYDYVLDISETSPHDLLLFTQHEEVEGGFRFHYQERLLLKALKEGKRILLTGRFSEEFAQALAPYLLNTTTWHPQSAVVLVSEKEVFPYLASTYHEVSGQEKLAALKGHYPKALLESLPKDLVHRSSLSQLRARLNYLRLHPEEEESLGEKSWQGLRGLRGGVHFNSERKEEALAFYAQRREAIFSALSYSPYVFITGLTGVGKSSFVDKKYLDSPGVHLYKGEEEMLQWLKLPEKDHLHLLFIDEANLSSTQWSLFEGLFHTPRGLLYKGDYYPLSEHHKVIFAGNPVNYGDERHLASFFERHGNALVFDTIPPEVIEESILTPLFKGTPLAAFKTKLTEPFLKVYRHLSSLSQERVLISPRELQTMALLLLSYAKRNPGLSEAALEEVASYYAYAVGQTLLPASFKEAFAKEYAPLPSLPRPPWFSKEALGDFYLTPSREPVCALLHDLLAVRELKQGALTEEVAFGGLGGLIIEGASGLGKSHLVSAWLKEAGAPVYDIKASLDVDKKKELLLKAFNEGAVALVDEINSSPMMERFLNDLLMGYHPQTKARPKPGFFIIGTQNPVTMAGRRAMSPALARRLLTLTLPPYPRKEMRSILTQKGLPAEKALQLIAVYEKNLAKAREEHLHPEPNFRDVVKVAMQIVEGHSKALPKPKIPSPVKSSQQEAIEALKEKLSDYLLRRSSKTETVNGLLQTRQYLHSSFFSCFQKSFAQKKEAVETLLAVLEGKNLSLDHHVAVLRNGELGHCLRAFIKQQRADPIVEGKPVRTVRDFLAALKNLRSKRAEVNRL